MPLPERLAWLRLWPALLILLLLALAFATGAEATMEPFSVADGRLPSDLGPSGPAATADIDGDGDLDVYLPRAARLLVNDCAGGFWDATPLLMGSPPVAETAVFADLTGDGAPDLFLARTGANRLYLNDGSGIFTDVSSTHLPADDEPSRTATAGDLDGDGDLDLVVGNGSALGDRLLINDGGRFRDETLARMPLVAESTIGLGLADLEADGDLDLVVATEGCRRDLLFLNDGAGRFADATEDRMLIFSPAGWSRAAVAGDFDADGRTDLYLAQGSPNCHLRDILLRNEGAILRDVGFTDLPGRAGLATEAVAAGDLDGDGDLDLALAQTPSLVVLAGDGEGRFFDVPAGTIPELEGNVASAAVGDFDLDGRADLLVSFLDTSPVLLVAGDPHRPAGPPEVSAPGSGGYLRVVRHPGPAIHLRWNDLGPGPFRYNLYQGVLGRPDSHSPISGFCHIAGGTQLLEAGVEVPTGGGSFTYLVTASSCAGEGSSGAWSDGRSRTARSSCGGF